MVVWAPGNCWARHNNELRSVERVWASVIILWLFFFFWIREFLVIFSRFCIQICFLMLTVCYCLHLLLPSWSALLACSSSAPLCPAGGVGPGDLPSLQQHFEISLVGALLTKELFTTSLFHKWLYQNTDTLLLWCWARCCWLGPWQGWASQTRQIFSQLTFYHSPPAQQPLIHCNSCRLIKNIA